MKSWGARRRAAKWVRSRCDDDRRRRGPPAARRKTNKTLTKRHAPTILPRLGGEFGERAGEQIECPNLFTRQALESHDTAGNRVADRDLSLGISTRLPPLASTERVDGAQPARLARLLRGGFG
jgi:hypothetical protein